jgi:hypothetical protein
MIAQREKNGAFLVPCAVLCGYGVFFWGIWEFDKRAREQEQRVYDKQYKDSQEAERYRIEHDPIYYLKKPEEENFKQVQRIGTEDDLRLLEEGKTLNELPWKSILYGR